MEAFEATVHWERGDARFTDLHYSRRHRWVFDGGAEVPASSSPQSVPLPFSDPAAIDPEEAFIASLASCHMLWFLSIAARAGWVIDEYQDHAQGTLGRNAEGHLAMLEVRLQPRTRFAPGPPPSMDQLRALHHQAHERCFIAHSVRTTVICTPSLG